MLFNSYEFIFAFLPCSLLGFYLAAAIGRRAAAGWLVACSIFFYGWWNEGFVLLLLGSMTFNYGLSRLIEAGGEARPRLQRGLLGAGIGADLLLLFFYKYLFTLLSFLGLRGLLPQGLASGIILPLGISFFTFTQIGYLVDTAAGLVKRHHPLDYMLFVTFFPHLIAGPILHNGEMIPQFANPATYRFRVENLSVGMSIFVIGLCKKVVIADPLGEIADPGFAHIHSLTVFGAWQAVLGYSLQLYFDFSGYSDMAIGAARMFGIVFPLNFNSPYKSHCIIDFWQRWHITLTRYLNLYVYNPLAIWVTRRRMSRKLGASRRDMRTAGGFASMIIFPTTVTIVLAGIWHGAGFQFLIFGALHAFYLSVNHAWRVFRPRKAQRSPHQSAAGPGWGTLLGCISLTYAAVLVGQIFFRASSAPAAVAILGRMVGMHATIGQVLVPGYLLGHLGGLGNRLVHAGLVTSSPDAVEMKAWMRILIGYVLVWSAPNTQQLMSSFGPALDAVRPRTHARLLWQPNARWGMAIAALMIASLYNFDKASRFLYFQF